MDPVSKKMHASTARSNQWVLAAAALLAVIILAIPMPGFSLPPMERYFRIEASQFSYNPGVLRVNPGDQVTIDLVALDVVHGFDLEGYDVQARAIPGQTTRLTFTADRAGVFRFRCSVACGNLHPFMLGKLTVGSNTLLMRTLILAIAALGLGLWSGAR
jgi:heme/copper-type cytochrome/quinol oxidase subunit 2